MTLEKNRVCVFVSLRDKLFSGARNLESFMRINLEVRSYTEIEQNQVCVVFLSSQRQIFTFYRTKLNPAADIFKNWPKESFFYDRKHSISKTLFWFLLAITTKIFCLHLFTMLSVCYYTSAFGIVC